MMKERIEDMLNDVLLLAPELENKKKELRHIVRELISLKPEVRMDERFKKRLEADLLARFSREPGKEKKNRFSAWFSRMKLKIAFAGLIASVIAFTINFLLFNQGKEEQAVISFNRDVIEIDLKETRQFRIRDVKFDLGKCVFVDKNNQKVDGRVKIRFKNFNRPGSIGTSHPDLVLRENNRNVPLVSGGMFDLNIYNKKEKLKIKNGSSIEIHYPVLKHLARTEAEKMNIYSFNEKTGRWQFESRPDIVKTDNRDHFQFNLTHLSYWNIDYPIKTHACIRGRVRFSDGKDVPDNSVRVIALGKDYIGRTSAYVKKGVYEIDVKRSSRIKVIALFRDKEAGVLENVSIGDKQGASREPETTGNYKYRMTDIILSQKKYNELYKNNVLKKAARSEKTGLIIDKYLEDVAFEGSENPAARDPLQKNNFELIEALETKIREKIIFTADVIEKTYLKVWIDGKEKDSSIYRAGQKIRFEADDSLQLKIGNAGCLKAKVNGIPVKLGKSGTIASKIIKWEKDIVDGTQYNLIIRDWK